MGIEYEWLAEEMDGEDIVDVWHRPTFQEILRDAECLRAEGKTICIGLVRDRGDEVEGLQDRQWAYLDKNGKLPAEFDGGAKVPERFFKETQQMNWNDTMGCRNVGVGPAAAGAKPGQKFSTSASDDWAIGQELTTWSGLRVRVTAKRDNHRFGSWKYDYDFEVVGGGR